MLLDLTRTSVVERVRAERRLRVSNLLPTKVLSDILVKCGKSQTATCIQFDG